MLGYDIKGSTVGIVGFGGIGQSIAQRLQGYEIKELLYTGRNEKPEAKKYNAKYVSFDELLKTSDFVIAACPLTPETKEMFNEAAFNKMKPTSIFVNVARGRTIVSHIQNRVINVYLCRNCRSKGSLQCSEKSYNFCSRVRCNDTRAPS